MIKNGFCPNGKIEGIEICDDNGAGGCSPNCSKVNTGYYCTNTSIVGGITSTCVTKCGDGIMAGTE